MNYLGIRLGISNSCCRTWASWQASQMYCSEGNGLRCGERRVALFGYLSFATPLGQMATAARLALGRADKLVPASERLQAVGANLFCLAGSIPPVRGDSCQVRAVARCMRRVARVEDALLNPWCSIGSSSGGKEDRGVFIRGISGVPGGVALLPTQQCLAVEGHS